MISGIKDAFFRIFGLAGPRGGESVTSASRGEGGYVLVIATIVGFLLTANYLLGQSPTRSEDVRLAYLVEPSGQELAPADALAKLNSGDFKTYKGGTETLDLGYMREGVWVHLTYRNPYPSGVERFVLQLRHTYINGSFSPLLLPQESSGPAAFSIAETKNFTDKLLPRTQGLNDIRHVSFPVAVSPSQEFHALIRLKAHVMSVPFVLLPEREFLSSIVREMVINASFFGGLMLLAMYNAMVGVARRENEFIFYGLYIAFISLMIAAINGSGHMFIWPDNLWLHYNSANILINLCSVSYLAFTLFLFRHDPLKGWERRIWVGLFTLCAAGLLLQFVEGGFFASIEANLAAIATLCVSLVRAWRARPVYGRIANLFLISESMLFLGAVIYCVKMFGWLPSTHFTINIVTLAATLEGILLSFVLSEKMRRTMNERELAMERLAAAQKHLEAGVRDRTLALAARYTSHEVLNPVFAIRLKIERIRDEIHMHSAQDNTPLLTLSPKLLTKTNEIFKLIDSIIHTIRAIKTLAGDGMREEPVRVDIASAFDDAMRMLEAKALQVDCRIESEFPAGTEVMAKRSDVVHVLMNLVSNSLDALISADKKWIRVSSLLRTVTRDSGARTMVEIEVLDSGSGPLPGIRAQLFEGEVTTKGAGVGMGLGLAFCQKLVLRNEGIIAYDSESNVTRFYFLLPVAAASLVPAAGDESLKAA
jgi:signal transduction histidine kinase